VQLYFKAKKMCHDTMILWYWASLLRSIDHHTQSGMRSFTFILSLAYFRLHLFMFARLGRWASPTFRLSNSINHYSPYYWAYPCCSHDPWHNSIIWRGYTDLRRSPTATSFGLFSGLPHWWKVAFWMYLTFVIKRKTFQKPDERDQKRRYPTLIIFLFLVVFAAVPCPSLVMGVYF
jgi:hypothetical protein